MSRSAVRPTARSETVVGTAGANPEEESRASRQTSCRRGSAPRSFHPAVTDRTIEPAPETSDAAARASLAAPSRNRRCLGRVDEDRVDHDCVDGDRVGREPENGPRRRRGRGAPGRTARLFRIARRDTQGTLTDSEGERIPCGHTYGSAAVNASRTRRCARRPVTGGAPYRRCPGGGIVKEGLSRAPAWSIKLPRRRRESK